MNITRIVYFDLEIEENEKRQIINVLGGRVGVSSTAIETYFPQTKTYGYDIESACKITADSAPLVIESLRLAYDLCKHWQQERILSGAKTYPLD